jgi:hypothetical protein
MLAGVGVTPNVFPEALELEDGEAFGFLGRFAKNMNDFLGNGSMSFDGARLNLPIQTIGDFLDIQCGHLFLRNETIPLWRSENCRSSRVMNGSTADSIPLHRVSEQIIDGFYDGRGEWLR